MKLYESQKLILNAKSLDELSSVVDSVMSEAGFPFDETMSYGDNAAFATLSCRPGVAQILTLAHKRERALL